MKIILSEQLRNKVFYKNTQKKELTTARKVLFRLEDIKSLKMEREYSK